MPNIQSDYDLPDELMAFVDSGFLEVKWEKPAEKTIRFHIPAMVTTDGRGRFVLFEIEWIHPAFNSQFCSYYDQVRGDLPNFNVIKFVEDRGDELLDIDTPDDLIPWLSEVADRVPPNN
ncbi:MAG: hypothetical protein AABP62_14990 [Planctomycetota bacterium]